MKRIFVGIPVHVNIYITALLDDFYKNFENEKVKWVDQNNFHLTIKFIGQTSDDNIPKIREVLRGAYKDVPAFQVFFKSAGVFKSIQNPRVLWIGIKNTEALQRISNITETELQKVDIPLSDKAFHPHLTIGRIKYLKKNNKLAALMDKYDKQYLGEQKMNSIVLFESKMTENGVKYEVVERFVS